MSQMSNLIGFWNIKSTAEVITRPQPRPEAIKTRKWENKILSNPAQSVSGSAGYGHITVEDLPVDRAGGRGKILGKTAPDILEKIGPEKKSDKKNAKECLPEKRAGLDLQSGNHDTSLRSDNPRAVQDKPVSPFAKFKQMENDQASSNHGSCSSPRMTNLSRNSSLPSSPRPTLTHAQLSAPGPVAARSGSGAKEIILGWVQQTLKDYPIPMTNFSSCWSNGLAFCALIHAFYPDSFDWNSLKAENKEYNFSLGFEAAEVLAGISPLLEVEDMVRYDRPDWKCVFCYVQSFYRRFRNVSNPTQAHVSNPTQAHVSNHTQAHVSNPTQAHVSNPTQSNVTTITAHSQDEKQSGKTVITSQHSSTPTIEPVTETSIPKLVTESNPPKTLGEIHSSSSLQPTEDKAPTINTNYNLNPTVTGKTTTRSKSMSADPPEIAKKAVREKKYSFNYSNPDTHLVSFNTRQ